MSNKKEYNIGDFIQYESIRSMSGIKKIIDVYGCIINISDSEVTIYGGNINKIGVLAPPLLILDFCNKLSKAEFYLATYKFKKFITSNNSILRDLYILYQGIEILKFKNITELAIRSNFIKLTSNGEWYRIEYITNELIDSESCIGLFSDVSGDCLEITIKDITDEAEFSVELIYPVKLLNKGI